MKTLILESQRREGWIFLLTYPNLILLTVVNSRNILPRTVHNFVTRSVPIHDGGKGLLVNITQRWGQTCGWRQSVKPHYHNRVKM